MMVPIPGSVVARSITAEYTARRGRCLVLNVSRGEQTIRMPSSKSARDEQDVVVVAMASGCGLTVVTP